MNRSLAARTARRYGYTGNYEAKIGALILGYWSISPITTGLQAITEIVTAAKGVGLLDWPTLGQCFAGGQCMALGFRAGVFAAVDDDQNVRAKVVMI